MPHDPFYGSREWKDLRASILRQRPICESPGCGKRASHCDHKVSRRRGGAALDPGNIKALCHGCHSSKTASVDGGFGNPENRKGCDADGWPAHPLPTQVALRP